MTPLFCRAIIHNMMEDNVNPTPVLLLINYWELRPSKFGARLDELLKKGVHQIAAFIPWQAVESDITHSLTRFLQSVIDRKMKVFLILSPELGVHYPDGGLPKNILSRKENIAQHAQAGPVTVTLPPHMFQLPSLLSPELSKRYFGYLVKMNSFFNDLSKNHSKLEHYLTVVLSGSFWKYYRSPHSSSQMSFGGLAGDYSNPAALSYRQEIEQLFSQREYTQSSLIAANQWKVRSLEETNRRWFYQKSEKVFRQRSLHTLKKNASARCVEFEIYTPEADPSLTYSRFIQMIAGGYSDFRKISNLLDESMSRLTGIDGHLAAPFIHWTTMGGFRLLSEAEKQFFILKSILQTAPQGGGILIEDSEWFSFSSNFRSKVEHLAKAFKTNELQFKNKILYYCPHSWSYVGSLWEALVEQVGPQARLVSSMPLVLQEKHSQVLMVDPSLILNQEMIQKFTAWTKAGRVVVLPRSSLYTEWAKKELERTLQNTQSIEVDIGLTYRLYKLGAGKLILYDVLGTSTPIQKSELLVTWKNFVQAIVSLAEVEAFYKVDNPKLVVIPFEKNQESLVLFVLNGNHHPITANLIFSTPVKVLDFGTSFAPLTNEEIEKTGTLSAKRFTLDVPPCGVLPLIVEGLNLSEMREKHLASLVSLETEASALSAASTVLPGFDSNSEDLTQIWN